jgi:hypothetical protein
MLGAFKMKTLHVCPFSVTSVPEGERTDISSTLASIRADHCWNVEYQQQEDTMPILDASSLTADNKCADDAQCGWPGSGLKCLQNPEDGQNYCMIPMFRVKLITDDTVTMNTDMSGFDLGTDDDTRLCNNLPASARHTVMCEDPQTQVVGPCDPPVHCDVDVPADCECKLPYGLSLSSFDFPRGHTDVPGGGRILVGFNLNRTPLSAQASPTFLSPSMELTGGTRVSAVQIAIRYLMTQADGSYMPMEGAVSAFGSSETLVRDLYLPPFLNLPGGSGLTDAAFKVWVTFVPVDPIADCASVSFKRTYAVVTGLKAPAGGTNLPATVPAGDLAPDGLVGVKVNWVNRVTVDETEYASRDNAWRIYAPSGTTDIQLPAAANPIPSGEEAWVTIFASHIPYFDFDLFPTEGLLSRQMSHTQDSWAVVVP